jgi:hypothetical protein
MLHQWKGAELFPRIAYDAAGAYLPFAAALRLRGKLTHLKFFTNTRSSAVFPASLTWENFFSHWVLVSFSFDIQVHSTGSPPGFRMVAVILYISYLPLSGIRKSIIYFLDLRSVLINFIE